MRQMKFLVPVLFALLVISLPVAAGDLKIGYADLQMALNESDAGKKAKQDLKEEVGKFEKELETKQEGLKKLKEEIDKKKGVWNSDTLKAKEKEFRDTSQAFQKRYMEYNDRLTQKKREKESQIIDELRDVVTELAKKGGYTYVFERSVGGLLYGPPEADLTQDVIKVYNKRFREKTK